MTGIHLAVALTISAGQYLLLSQRRSAFDACSCELDALHPTHFLLKVNCSELATLPFQRPDVSWRGPISRCCVLFLALFGRERFQGIFPWQQLLNSIFVLLGQVWCLDRPLPVYQFLEKRNEATNLVHYKLQKQLRHCNPVFFTRGLFLQKQQKALKSPNLSELKKMTLEF